LISNPFFRSHTKASDLLGLLNFSVSSFSPARSARMPWLTRGEWEPSENLFFVHVPRCGGTSLTQHFDVPRKCRKGRSCWGKFGMLYFFYRYRLLESANFPLKTWEALIALLQLLASLALFIFGSLENRRIPIAAYTLLFGAVCMFTFSTFVFTAPVIGRVNWIRRSYLILVHYVMFRFMESIEWCSGTNIKGYMMHLTAQKLMKYGYVSADTFNSVCSLAIVRDPFSRMVSIYMYNRFGPLESFRTFLKRWHHMLRFYRERGEMEEYYTPCHLIPQFEYTHFEGKQLVHSVVKQEELKYLKTTDEAQKAIAAGSTVGDLPDTVRNALLGMPHANRRDSGKKWFEYFDQETLDMTYEMYKKDFLIFDYPPSISQRRDLKPAAGSTEANEVGAEPAQRNSAFRLEPCHFSRQSGHYPRAQSCPASVCLKLPVEGSPQLTVLHEASVPLETVNSGIELMAISMTGPSRTQSVVISLDSSAEGDDSQDCHAAGDEQIELNELTTVHLTHNDLENGTYKPIDGADVLEDLGSSDSMETEAPVQSPMSQI